VFLRIFGIAEWQSHQLLRISSNGHKIFTKIKSNISRTTPILPLWYMFTLRTQTLRLQCTHYW